MGKNRFNGLSIKFVTRGRTGPFPVVRVCAAVTSTTNMNCSYVCKGFTRNKALIGLPVLISVTSHLFKRPITNMATNAAYGKDTDDALRKAATAVKNARALIVTAGAGMGVDSGLPDFRGAQGFWRAYPLLKEKGLNLSSMSNPSWFHKNPEFAWWFFGHRYNLYTSTTPHEGFTILKKWGEKMDHGYFVFTSNVDGHFQRAGFDEDRVAECHGSINFMQCADDSNGRIWPVPEGTKYDVDNETMKMTSPLPRGPPNSKTQYPARPNILMFGDWLWVGDRTSAQEERFCAFQTSLMKDGGIPFVVVEIGAGLAVPTVRLTSESLVGRNKGVLIRINPHESKVPNWPKDNISLPLKGLEALNAIDNLLSDS